MATSMWTARRLSLAAFGAACVLLILVGWMSVRQAVNLREANRAVERTLTVREELEVSLSLVKDAETGQRGFLITQYLEPYELARTSMGRRWSRASRAARPEDDEPKIRWARKLFAAMEPHLEPAVYVNSLGGPDDGDRVHQAFGDN